MFLVLVDATSKWLDVCIMSSITSSVTIEKLQSIFSVHGLPKVIVTDNGRSFVSDEFESFCSSNGIKHLTSSPYHPTTNGLAERGVQTFKHGVKRMAYNQSYPDFSFVTESLHTQQLAFHRPRC